MSECTIDEQKQKIIYAVDNLSTAMRTLALQIHAAPELSFAEHRSAAALIAPLAAAGFSIERPLAGLDTAFRARWQQGNGGPTIALLAEYDALAELGHACGHNLIGTASVAAALALRQAGVSFNGTLEVIGTPAEEEGGGKIIMAGQGVFAGVDAVMMFHPREKNMVTRGALACVDFVFKFYGKAAHAASAPQRGISALDAVIQTFVGVNALRQFFTDDVRVHGIITNGGQATNIVPAYAEAKFLLRAATVKGLQEVRRKVLAATQAAAEMSGARLEIEEGLTYAERNNNLTLAAVFGQNLQLLGQLAEAPPEQGGVGSSDIGNVSQLTAAIHPYLRIGDVYPHTPEFALAAASESGLNTMLIAAKALAMSAFDLCHSAATLQAVRQEFTQWKSHAESGDA
ncbi:amidohydrolase [Erwinia sp. OLTSP20]|uniref:M20 family metallopeptidase n=1 Tax=unclassified Erwinia TaxID=2622719 RepID=UPI000C19B268|nr:MULTISPECIES: M20 family metallopeptidase [unclassified Erwinia]PIJ48441.1 amidohydrolase [Erwinia sp. OAMSP11]PIJ65972.1 amidohydrolase [Erwinia sp. OLSSP12]PIJ78597.1 amidohydrolase [Erwinia sp. OLCASP19]PIJ79071.1 amidohydrolase [Erwinia sp. OLMTSP26]PIJ80964.1 amidohydrolase [Erwinia sp. OLMDSP33]